MGPEKRISYSCLTHLIIKRPLTSDMSLFIRGSTRLKERFENYVRYLISCYIATMDYGGGKVSVDGAQRSLYPFSWICI